jgi:predicted phosphodiesterase
MERTFAICSDIHGNWEALKAVTRDMDRLDIEHRICLGDVIGYGAEPARCVDHVMKNDWLVLTGNHEEGLIYPQMLEYFNGSAVAGIRWAQRQLDKNAVEWISELPHVIQGSTYELVHASLCDPMSWDYVVTDEEAERHFELQVKKVCFCGHTHTGMIWRKGRRIYSKSPSNRQFRLPKKQKVLINVGSVGQPRDGSPKASYVLFKPERRTVQFRRVRYDIEKARQKILDVGLPKHLGDRLRIGH